ncbi:biotin--[acetyl-CoA-carboxylase] ligase, partial [Staphylococcus arlettae]
MHTNEQLNRYYFLQSLIKNIEYRYNQFINNSFDTIRDEYIAASNIWHKRLRFTENKEQFYGEVIDIDNNGFLLVTDENNQTRKLMSADIDF